MQENIRRVQAASSPRRGTTLIEMVATLSVLLVLGLSAVRVLGSVTDVGRKNVNENRGRASVERLAQSLRRDVNRSDNVLDNETENAWPLNLRIEDQSVRYNYDSNTSMVHRTVSREQERLSFDSFPLPPPCEPRLSITNGIIQLVLREQGEHRWIIEAALP